MTPRPPFLGTGAHNLLVRYEADPDAVRALLPPVLEPASAVLTLNMYAVANGLGIPAYNRTYVWADVVGFDAWDGTNGRSVLAGFAEPAGFRTIATDLLHWPAEPGETRLSRDGDEIRASLSADGREIASARARVPAGDAPGKVVMNLLPYLFVEPPADGRRGVGINHVPFGGRVRAVEPLAVEFRAPEGHPLAALAPRRLVEAFEVTDGSLALGVIERV